MNWNLISADKNGLPNALLPAFKRWQRIDFSSDDLLITEVIQGAIEQFERNSEITVFPSTIQLLPEDLDYACGSGTVLRLPVTPINAIGVIVDPAEGEQVPHSDMTLLVDDTGYVAGPLVPLPDGYAVRRKGFHGVSIYSLTGPYTAGMLIQIDTGYSIDTLPPEIRQAIMQIGSHMYEFRDILVPTNLSEPPMWLNQAMAGFWLPRV